MISARWACSISNIGSDSWIMSTTSLLDKHCIFYKRKGNDKNNLIFRSTWLHNIIFAQWTQIKKYKISFLNLLFCCLNVFGGHILNIFTFYLQTKDDPSVSVHFVNLFSIGGFIQWTSCFTDIQGKPDNFLSSKPIFILIKFALLILIKLNSAFWFS